ncbi:MAG: serine/threonine protein kinase [Verrucomicrobiales bacterium]
MSDRYQIKEKIGQGGLGEVYVAVDTQLQREVALKRVRAAEGQSPEDVLREAKVLSALQHPNILTVFDVGQDVTGPFVITELLRGETLEQVVVRQPLGYEEFRLMAIQTLEGLVAAQAMNLVHRDLKPGNLMVVRHASGRFQVKILDFGLAKFSRHASRQTEDQQAGIMGSIYFMAPEQFERVPLDGRTDLYALGCIFYFSLTGKNPFDGDTPPVIMASHLAHHVTPLGQMRPDLPPWACDWVMWFINRRPADRPHNAQEALDTFQKQSAAWEAAMQAAPLAAAAAMAAAPPPPVAVAPHPTGPVRVGARPATAPIARGQEAVRRGRRQKPKPLWLLYGLPTVLVAAAGYGLWRMNLNQEAVRKSSEPGRILTPDDLVFPEPEESEEVKGLAVGDGSTPLAIDQARIVGTKARRRTSIKAIGYWSSSDTRVVWDIVFTKSGEYEVVVIQSLEHEKMGGRYQVSVAGSKVSGEAKKTPNKDQFIEVSLGTVQVAKKGPTTLEMWPTEVIGTSLMNLGGVTLRRK